MAAAPKTTRTTTRTAKTTTTSATAAKSASATAPEPTSAPMAASAAPAPPQTEEKRSGGFGGLLVAALVILALIVGAGGYYLYDRYDGGQLLAGNPAPVVVEHTIVVDSPARVVRASADSVRMSSSGERCLAIVAPHATKLVMTGAASGGPAQAAVKEWPLETTNWQQVGEVFSSTVCLSVSVVERHAESGMSLCQDGLRGSCWAFRPGAAMTTLISSDIGPRRPLCLAANDWCSNAIVVR